MCLFAYKTTLFCGKITKFLQYSQEKSGKISILRLNIIVIQHIFAHFSSF